MVQFLIDFSTEKGEVSNGFGSVGGCGGGGGEDGGGIGSSCFIEFS